VDITFCGRVERHAGLPAWGKARVSGAVAVRRAIDEHRRWEQAQPGGDPEEISGESPGAGRVGLTRVQAEPCLTVIGEMPGMRRSVVYLKVS
jgi:hypothetical protein